MSKASRISVADPLERAVGRLGRLVVHILAPGVPEYSGCLAGAAGVPSYRGERPRSEIAIPQLAAA